MKTIVKIVEWGNKVKRIELLFIALVVSLWPASTHAEIGDYFTRHNLDGTIIVSSLKTGREYVHNASRAKTRYLPASMFKILNTLIALEERAIADENDLVSWDGQDYGLAGWNRDQCIRTAFPTSCVWFYQKLAQRIGQPTYLKYLERVNYGNRKTGKNVETFWLDGDIRISAEEQIVFLQKVYQRKLPFGTKAYDVLQRVMIEDKTADYILRAKTGWAMRAEKQVGWYVGYVETRNDVWFFACNLDIRQPGEAKHRKDATYATLRELGIIK